MAIESKKWVIPVTLVLLLASIITFSSSESEGAPEGYVTMEDILVQYPYAVIKEGDDYRIIADLHIPATKLLFLGPGEKLLFEKGIHLNLTGAPLFEGTTTEPVSLEPLVIGEMWGGINLMEGDISTSSVIKNTTISGAVIGIRSHLSDLHMYDSRIINCSRNGLDIKGPIPSNNEIIIDGSTIMNATYYGIHLLKVQDVTVTKTSIIDCGTGVRAYGSTATFDDIEVIDTKNIGMNPVDLDLWIDGIKLISASGSTSIQFLALNSTVQMFDGEISGANTGISILTGSEIYLDGTRLDNIFTDGIQARDATLTILNSEISRSGENAIHIVDTQASISGTTFANNGKGTGEVVFSSVNSERSNIKFEVCNFLGSGYGHIYSASSSITIANSTLGAISNEKFELDLGSNLKLVNIVPPSDTSFLDEDLTLEYLNTIVIELVDFETKAPIVGGQVDLRNIDGDWIATGYTGPEGRTEPLMVKITKFNFTGAYGHLPINIIAQKEGYEVSTFDIEVPIRSVMMEMYPPNNAPELSLIGPVNGTTATEYILLEGTLRDDLDITSLKVRFDEGQYRTFDEIQTDSGGHFKYSVPLGNLSGGFHVIWVHAFDNSHISPPETRRIIVIDPRVNDTDKDGIPDIDEDVNGNGQVDDGETDPNKSDSDGDLLIDGIEIDISDGNSTDPLDIDTDGDYLIDGVEDQNMNGRVDANETDPNIKDTDGDGVDDGDDMYPLDPYRTKDVTDDGDSTAVIILASLFLICLIVAVYLFVVKTSAVHSKTELSKPEPRPDRGIKDRRDPEERETARKRKR